MDNTVPIECCCISAYDKGCAEMTFENDSFSIYGQLFENSYILIKCHDVADDIVSPTLKATFNNGSEQKDLPLSKCLHGKDGDYCALLNLEKNYFLNLCMNNSDEKNISIKINKDPLVEIMQRYNLDKNPELLPVKKNGDGFFGPFFSKYFLLIKKIITNSFSNH